MSLRDWKRFGISLALLATWCALATAAPDDRKGIVFRGRLADPESWPIAKVQVVVEGSRSASTLSDQDGRWSLTVPLATRGQLAHTPLSLTLRVRDATRSYSLANGRSELRLELSGEGVSDRGSLLAVRASDARVAETLARALRAEGDTNAIIPVMFVGRPRGRVPVPDTFGTALPAYEPVLLAGAASAAANSAAPAPATASPTPQAATSTPVPASAPPPASSSAQRLAPARAPDPAPTGAMPSPPATVQRAAPADTRSSQPEVESPAPEAPGDPIPWSRVEVITPSRYRSLAQSDSALLAHSVRGCACRIEGTIEVRSEQPLARRRPVVVVLNGEVALRDTIDLFMGSPRPFAFRDLPCGRYSLDVQVPGTTRFRLVTPRSMRSLSCAQGELRQIRLVLEPR
jgi:hypothetical protein